MTDQNRHYRISGRVQGVGFRYATQACAEQLGLTGWVSNLPNGDVAAEASGSAEALDAFEQWLHSGPSHARVRSVASRPADTRAFDGFAIKR